MTTKQAKSETSRHEAAKSAVRSRAAAHGDGQSVAGEHAADTVKEGIVKSLSGLDTIEADITILVRKTVSDALGAGAAAGGDMINVVHYVVMGAIDASEQVGTGLTMSTKSVAKGIVMGVHDVGGDVITASFETMRSLIRHAATIGADVGTVTRNAIDGVIEATVETGGNVTQVGKKAIEGAIEEAASVSNMAVKAVRDVLIGVAGSVGQTLGAAMPQGAHEAHAMQPTHAEKKPSHH
jgi:hypothetical protein